MMASYTSQAFLTKEEFYVALRLIAYAQNNIECSEKSVKLNIEVALPTFNLGGPGGPAQAPGQRANDPPPAFKPEQINELPGLDDLDPALMDNINSLIPAVDQRMKMEQQKQQREYEQRMNQVPPGTFLITPQDKMRYEGLYSRFDAQGQGYVAD